MKDKIISKAKDLFLKIGFKSVTMDDIASEMGISKKTIYKFFSNKDELIQTAIEEFHTEIMASLTEIVSLNYNAIHENFVIKHKVNEMFQTSESSPLYQLKKHYPLIYENITKNQIELFKNCFRTNITRGISEGLYRDTIYIEDYVDFYYILIFAVNENTISKRLVQEIEYKVLEYHLRAIATPKGLLELEKQLQNQLQ
jgi:AcrR family transcriptional regulator